MFNKRFLASVDSKANHKYCSPKILENVMAEFKILDTDESGGISYEEYKASHLAQDYSDDEARQIFKQLDLNNNGVIELNEFRDYRLATIHKSHDGFPKDTVGSDIVG